MTPKDPLVQQGVQKLQGYNQGFSEAVTTFQDIIAVLFLAQIIQIITHRLLYRENPFSITLNSQFTGEELRRYGSEKQVTGRTRRIIKLIDNSAFTVALFLSAFLFLQIYLPAYTWSVN